MRFYHIEVPTRCLYMIFVKNDKLNDFSFHRYRLYISNVELHQLELALVYATVESD
jgi:hypothetical protein